MIRLSISILVCWIMAIPARADKQDTTRINADSSLQNKSSYVIKMPDEIVKEFGQGKLTNIDLAANGIPSNLFGDLNIGITASDPTEKCYQLFEIHKDLFGLINPREELLQYWTGKQDGAINTIKFRQMYNGIKIENGQYFVHFNRDGTLNGVNGHLFPEARRVNTTPTISIEQARQIAATNANTKGVKAGNVTHSELVIFGHGDTFHLCWALNITNFAVFFSEKFYVDAHSGEVLDKTSLLIDDSDFGHRRR